MPEDTTPEQAANKQQAVPKKRSFRPNPQIAMVMAVIFVIGLSVWGIYTAGYNKGKSKAEQAAKSKSAASTSSTVLPVSGQVSKITSKEITIKLLGDETRKARIDNQTQVTNNGATAQAGDIKVGGKVVLFSKNQARPI